jgi:hypothetical protein
VRKHLPSPRKFGLPLITFVFLATLALPVACSGNELLFNYRESGSPFTDSGEIIDKKSLPAPLYMRSKKVRIYESPNGSAIGFLGSTVMYPDGQDGVWTRGVGYYWVWNANVTPDLGEASVITDTADLHYTANGLEIGQIAQGTKFQKICVNKKNSWAFVRVDIWVKSEDVTAEESAAWDSGFFDNEYPLFTITTREAGDVSGTAAATTLSETGFGLVLFVGTMLFAGLTLVVSSWKGRRSVTRNSITISGVTSSSINVQSPLASALVAIDKKGDTETATALIQLIDLIENATLDSAQKRELKDLTEAITEEARKVNPRAATLRAIGSQLAISIAASAIATQAAPLMEVISRLWQ